MRPEGNESVAVRSHGRARLGRALLVEGLPLGAVDEALEHDGPVADAAQRARRDGQVVADDVELGELRLLREVGLARVGDADLAALDREDLGCLFLRHAGEATPRVMADTKQDVLDMLRELAELTMLDEGDPQSFRVRAYESAAQAIAAQATDLGRLTAKELQKIQGIGKSTAAKIRELLETGKVEKLEGLRAKHPASVVALLRIQGLGPEGRDRLRAELGVQSIDDLRQALAEHKAARRSRASARSPRRSSRTALARLDEQGSLEPDAHLGGAAARRAHRRAHARGARRHARVVLRLAPALLRDHRRRRHRRRRDRRRRR